MKFLRLLAISLLMILLFVNSGVAGFAMETGFSTEDVSDEKKESFLNNAKISLMTDEPPKRNIACFDVNENGKIAIGQSALGNNKTVCIYSGNGEFLYGYSFEAYGTFGVELTKDSLNIYFVRSAIAVEIDFRGEIRSVVEIQNTLENNSYWNNSVYLKERQNGDVKYIIKNNMGILNLFAFSYSQLITINSDGQENILYDVTSTHLLVTVIGFIAVLAFFCYVLFVVIRQGVKQQQRVIADAMEKGTLENEHYV